MTGAGEGSPIRNLVAEVMLDALGCLTGNVRGRAAHVRTGLTRQERIMAWRFWTRRDRFAVPCNLRFCCETLGIDLEKTRAAALEKAIPLRRKKRPATPTPAATLDPPSEPPHAHACR